MADGLIWTEFYSEFADKLLEYRDDRGPLVDTIHEIHKELGFKIMTDKFKDGSSGPIQDICPFTAMSEFNRHMDVQKRVSTQGKLAKLLGVRTPPPDDWPGVPLFFNLGRWLYPYASERDPGHIDKLWNVLAEALAYADKKSGPSKLVESFDAVTGLDTSIGMLTIGLFWIRPYVFLPLDSSTKQYLEEKIMVSDLNPQNGGEYLDLTERIRTTLKTKTDMDSFPRLSSAAYDYNQEEDSGNEPGSKDTEDLGTGDPSPDDPDIEGPPYSVDDIVADGCFVKKSKLQSVMGMLKNTKNLILQGPPGTGKTYLAKRLAYALLGNKSDSDVRAIQFHPNISYEDFVRGWRPDGGKLALRDGQFLDAINDARQDRGRKFVIIIEEINRGNPANIFGEMLTLIEADKRSEADAISLSYQRNKSEYVYVPPNLYIIGTMNVADRSIALVDMALRRRFDFFHLEPVFDEAWSGWVHENFRTATPAVLDRIGDAMISLNKRIEENNMLGPNFKIGHSYAMPKTDNEIPDTDTWWRNVVEYKIGPLLQEYWFEDPKTARKEKQDLLAALGT